MVRIFFITSLQEITRLKESIGLTKPVSIVSFQPHKDAMCYSFDLTFDEREECANYYVEHISNLVQDDIAWWARAVSEKNEHVSSYYAQLCRYFKIVHLIQQGAASQDWIIIDEIDVGLQLRAFCRSHGYDFIFRKQFVIGLKDFCFSFVKAWGKAFKGLFNIVFRRLIYWMKWQYFFERKLSQKEYDVCFRSWFDQRFLLSDGYDDAYFGSLPNIMKEKNKRILGIAGILEKFTSVIKKMMTLKHWDLIPEEHFMRISDLGFVFRKLFFSGKFKFGEIRFGNLDVSILFHRQMRWVNDVDRAIYNLMRYQSAKRLRMVIMFKKYFQPFENYAWEKMMTAGIKEIDINCVVAGFQHAFVSRNSFKYFPGRVEALLMPLPDQIVSLGKVTYDILEKYGSYPQKIERLVGCALRQKWSAMSRTQKKSGQTILIPLTMVKTETKRIIEFLIGAGVEKSSYNFYLRPHPACQFSSIEQEFGIQVPFNIQVSMGKTLQDDLNYTDVLIYCWSTVAVEALNWGIPVLYLDILKPMYVDPLFQCDHLKFSTDNPSSLLQIIDNIIDIKEEDYLNQKNIAQEYIQNYFYSINENNLNPFLL